MKRLGNVALILSELDLHDIEKIVWEPYHEEGPGRPPRNSMGIFKALMVKRLWRIPSDRELYRRLWDDPMLREICDIEDREKPYHPSQTRFRSNVGPERLDGIVDELVGELMEGGVIDGESVAMDATFIRAWSRRDLHDNRWGYSDPDARVGRDDRGYDLGYRAHIAADADSDLPVAYVAAPANENEKKHGPTLVERIREVLKKAGARLRRLVADSHYSSGRIRGLVDEAVIPFMANQRRDEDVLRVNGKFRTHGPEEERAKYHKRPAVEAAYAFLKTRYGMAVNKVRGLRNVAVYALYSVLCHVLTWEAAENIGRPDKAVSPTFFNT